MRRRKTLIDDGRMTEPDRSPRPSILRTQGFEAFYMAYHEQIMMYCRRRVSGIEIARDLAAETLKSAFEAQDTFRGTTELQERAWLWTIARHQLHDHYARNATQRWHCGVWAVLPSGVDDDAFERIDEIDAAERLIGNPRMALGKLKPHHRRPIEMRVFDELDYRTIGKVLGEHEDTVRKCVNDGLRHLCRKMDSETGW
jgi:RNA polymerase sigma-70 factor, ECF subfamily